MRQETQGFEQFSLTNAYKEKEEAFFKISKTILKNDAPDEANIIRSYTLYKVITMGNENPEMKSRIAPAELKTT